MKTKWKDTAQNHIGEHHNRLTIEAVDWDRTEQVRNDEQNKIMDTFYFCTCDCGKHIDHSIRYNSIKYGHIKSCGCLKINNPLIIKDLTGQTFERLTVIGRDEERDAKARNEGKNGNVHWLCKCSCGNPKLSSVAGSNLISGHIKSCGCYISEITAERNKRDSTKINHYVKLNNEKESNDENYIELFDEKEEFFFIISKEDEEVVSNYYWSKITEKTEPNPRKRYWITNSKESDNRPSTFRLHQLIAEQKYGEYDHTKFYPDHLDRNPDNNTRENLILKSNIDNSHNRGLSRTNTSGKTGVYKHYGKWTANITINYKTIYLGTYQSFDEAVKVRKKAEEKYGFACDDIKPDYDFNS